MEDPDEGECDEAMTCMLILLMHMYEDSEEEKELRTIIMDEGLMTIMMIMPFDRMKMKRKCRGE